MPVCLNHPEVEATTKCTTCFKPLCQECVVRRERHAYCSQQCLENHLRTSGNVSRVVARERAIQRRKLILQTATILVLAVVLIAAALFFLQKQGA